MSVIQLLDVFGKVTGTTLRYEIKPRRDGDICAMYANGERARDELGWAPKYSLEQMCKLHDVSLSLSPPICLLGDGQTLLAIRVPASNFQFIHACLSDGC